MGVSIPEIDMAVDDWEGSGENMGEEDANAV
eukprot:CAMPEP_0183740704 /NCGR_PEP_ID=MMETSP0737-20130205/60300_1 /TAXON_ID=385413 /ORGANISM="Thalassiosira miniscula, Strain CCMP1093" /LENGTH=30 /DNA_ID= /DNA_START= /DNA_END= /DNA_ORIENTATION=